MLASFSSEVVEPKDTSFQVGFVRGEFVQHFLQSEKGLFKVNYLDRLIMVYSMVSQITESIRSNRIVSSSELHSGNLTWNLKITCFLQ